MPKFFVEDEQIKNKQVIIIGEDVNHIVNVLRLTIDSEIIICNKKTEISYKTKIIKTEKQNVICEIIEQIENTTESNVNITIFQGLPKSDKMEYIIQKSTELGVKKIVPVALSRCIVKLEPKEEQKKLTRWQKIAEVAAKQSGRDYIPKIENIIKAKEICNLVPNYDILLIAYENEINNSLKTELQKIQNKENLKIGVIIGPEGGLEETEVELIKNAGGKVITLGKRILRTETVALTVISNIIYEYEM